MNIGHYQPDRVVVYFGVRSLNACLMYSRSGEWLALEAGPTAEFEFVVSAVSRPGAAP